MAIMKVSDALVSNCILARASTLLSGVPRTISMPTTDTATDAMKIQRQPTFSAIRPPNSAAKPEPPHDPIDHKLIARWRPPHPSTPSPAPGWPA